MNSPAFNKNPQGLNLSVWTIDFFILEIFEHKGVMYNAVVRVLNQLKEMGIATVYCLVDRENSDCKRLVGNGLFQLVDNSGFKNIDSAKESPLVYMIDLRTIKFMSDR